MQTIPYVLGSIQCTYTCAPLKSKHTLLHDALRDQAWETFGNPALESYFECGVEKFRMAFEDFTDTSIPFTENSKTQLVFMLEALMHARQLIAETR